MKVPVKPGFFYFQLLKTNGENYPQKFRPKNQKVIFATK
jgi:hypothetical protein